MGVCPGAGGVAYTYDGDGKRVKKSNGKLYWTGMGSDPLVETDDTGTVLEEYIFFNGKRIARQEPPPTPGVSPVVHFFFSDHLGSADVITNASGTMPPEQESDYYPFGGERAIIAGPNNYKFTGKERDADTGLDFFGARFYNSAVGRFVSPDEFVGGPVSAFSVDDPLPPSPLPYADVFNPQSLNKYAYTLNNPLRYVDPYGHEEDEPQGHPGVDGVTRDWMDVVEVKGSVGVGVGVSGQAGTVEYKAEATAIGVEAETGLGGGNADARVVSHVKVAGKAGPGEVVIEAGGEISAKKGADVKASAEVTTGAVQQKIEISAKNGGSTTATSAQVAKADIKVGVGAKIGIGVGVKINFSQAGRAWHRTVESAKSLVNAIAKRFLPDGPPR